LGQSYKAKPRTTTAQTEAKNVRLCAERPTGQVAPRGKLSAIVWDETTHEGASGFVATDEHRNNQVKATLVDGVVVVDTEPDLKSMVWCNGTYFSVSPI
jgi:hypothetical protein